MPTRADPFRPIAFAPTVLRGWTFRSDREGWWSAAGDEQLYASDVDLGTVCEGKLAAERADLLSEVFAESNRRNGGTPRPARANERPEHGDHAMVCRVSSSPGVRNLSCGFARDGSAALIGIEYTVYGDIPEAQLAERGTRAIERVAAAVLPPAAR
ncbi:MAG: hypothetical protein ABI175_13925 [Polyangiales bacterium]